MSKKRIAVLMGGWSAEREVSLSSGRGCAKALAEAGYDVTSIDVTQDISALLAALDPKPNVVFNALHGRGGEDGTIQALLNMLGIPYTHSGLTASAVAMDKPMAKQIFAQAGLPVPQGKVVPREDVLAGDPLPLPYVVKPPNEGSSVGVHIVREGSNRPPMSHDNLSEMVLVEPFIPGRELTVAVMGDKALGVIEIRATNGGWYDFESKYAVGGSEHIYPAPIHKAAYDEACAIALKAHQALGCRGVSRADLRYDDTAGEPGKLYLLEVNTQPGMTPTSLVPDFARAHGISYVDLVTWLVENAACDA